MRTTAIAVSCFLLIAITASSQQADTPSTTYDPARAFFLSAADVAARAAEFDPEVAYSNTTVLERADPSTATGLAYRMAVDRRIPPQRAAAHAAEAEVWAIVGGRGEITTDGRIVETLENGATMRRIEGGTVHQVSAGDFLMIPEGVPHEVTGFDPSLLIVTFEFPR